MKKVTLTIDVTVSDEVNEAEVIYYLRDKFDAQIAQVRCNAPAAAYKVEHSITVKHED